MSLDRRKNTSNEELGVRRSIHIPTTLRCPRSVMFSAVENFTETYLQKHPCVAWHQQEVLRKRHRRAALGQVPIKSSKASKSSGVDQILALNRSKRTKINFEDPLYEQQWHLHGGLGSNWTLPEEQSPLLHLNLRSAWESGVTGQGVTVCVIDDGLEWNHEDIRDNYNSLASYDLNADDPDPSPASNGENNEHGTRCAGEIAGVANSVCGVGVAYRASVSGLRVLGGRVTDSMEALAFSHQIQRNHVFSCSWGPEDDGVTVDGPRTLGRRALRWGTTYGRKGRGAVYVVASGNGGDVSDNCNYDGYANSVFTVTIGAVNSRGRPPFYAEWCAAMLAVAPSSGLHGMDIVTTDWHGRSTSGCTLHHTGTSAAAPLAAGVVALALHTQPCLGWRDLQHLLALSSVQIDPTHQDWTTNAAGLHHSHHYGFGLLDASAMVSAAAVWETLPFSSKYVGPKLSPDESSLDTGSVNVSFTILSDTLDRVGLRTLETVEVRVWLTHEYRGSVGYTLVCPSGTSSTLAPPRLKDTSTAGLSGWPLVTVRCWAESPGGLYQLRVQQSPQLDRQMSGQLVQWQLVLYGSSALPSEVLRRHESARAAMRGETVVVGNRSHLCHPVPPLYPPTAPLPASWLKVLVMLGCVAAVGAAATLVEYAFCHNAEKRRFRETLEQMALAHRTFRRRTSATRWQQQQHHLASSSSADGAHSLGLPLLAPPSPSPSCDADQSASPDECQSDDDDDEGGGACTSTTYPRDTTDAPPSSSSCCSSDEAVAVCRAGAV